MNTEDAGAAAGADGVFDAAFFRDWIDRAAAAVEARRDDLTRLDAEIGDGDHGTNLSRGFAAVQRALDSAHPETPATVLVLTGTTLISKVGGAAGPLYGTAFRRAGQSLPDAPAVGLGALADGLEAALAGVRGLGAATEGDKTMVDALAPAVAALRRAAADGLGPVQALRAMADAAGAGALDTVPMRARKGRASYLGERSIGHQDPGAASAALILGALSEAAAAAPDQAAQR
ncbi:MAG TPA: dihydroxyacetone kinase subunit DhaL [Actinocrinis sp.]